MGIFDIFKTKVSAAADKTGDVAEQAWDKTAEAAGDVKDKVTGMLNGDKDKDSAEDAAQEAARMVSEGAPVAEAGEAAPGLGDEGAGPAGGEAAGGGLTGTIKQNLSSGADQAAGMADSATGRKAGDQIQAGADKAKDALS